jgi:hypothetical protein
MDPPPDRMAIEHYKSENKPIAGHADGLQLELCQEKK